MTEQSTNLSPPGDGNLIPENRSRRAGGWWHILAPSILGVLSIVWILLAMTVFFVGPSEWDDNAYCDIAAVPRADTSIQARYVHIWTLRLFYLVTDSRRYAAALYSTLTVIGMMWVVYGIASRIRGPVTGLVAGAWMPLYPAVCKHTTVPYCDEPMILWSGTAVLCAMVASDSHRRSRESLALLGCGLFWFLAIKSKVTGLAVFPALVYALWPNGRKISHGATVVFGFLIGWFLLTVCDAVFLGDAGFSWRWTTYFASAEGSSQSVDVDADEIEYPVRMSMDFVTRMLQRSTLAFTIVGAAGLIGFYRCSRKTRVVAQWLFWLLVMQSVASCHWKGIEAAARYLVSFGPAMVIGAAIWFLHVWDSGARGGRPAWGLVVAGGTLVALTGYGIGHDIANGQAQHEFGGRLAFFLLPVTVVLLFAAPWLTRHQATLRIAVILLLLLPAGRSIYIVKQYAYATEIKLRPWELLTAVLDDKDADILMWGIEGKPFTRFRVERRIRTLSSRPAEDVTVREIESLDERGGERWLFTDLRWWTGETLPPEGVELYERGWRPVEDLVGQESNRAFVVCRWVPPPERG